MSNIKIIKSQRGGDVLCYRGHEYLIQRRMLLGRTLWRCRNYRSMKCPASLVTMDNTIEKEPGEHTHSGDPVQLQAKTAMSLLKNTARQSDASTRNLLGASMGLLDADTLARLPQKASIEEAIRRERRRNNFDLRQPGSIHFNIPEKYEDLVLFDSGHEDEKRILALGHKDVVQFLNESDLLLGDGTFKVVPQLFFQLYTVHAKVGEAFPPCLYFLLPDKTQHTYSKMLQALKIIAPNVRPGRILLDFEKGAINAFTSAFPTSHISGCFFHFTQSVIRKLQGLGLKSEYEADSGFNMLVKSLCTLAFVPTNDLLDVFGDLCREFPEGEQYTSLLKYFDETYIRGEQVPNRQAVPRFPPVTWNHFQDAVACAPKTTNACEGFHHALNAMFSCQHPTVWKLFEGILKDIGVQRLVGEQALAGSQPRNKYRVLSERLAQKVRNYHNEPDKLKYLRTIAHMQVP